MFNALKRIVKTMLGKFYKYNKWHAWWKKMEWGPSADKRSVKRSPIRKTNNLKRITWIWIKQNKKNCLTGRSLSHNSERYKIGWWRCYNIFVNSIIGKFATNKTNIRMETRNWRRTSENTLKRSMCSGLYDDDDAMVWQLLDSSFLYSFQQHIWRQEQKFLAYRSSFCVLYLTLTIT